MAVEAQQLGYLDRSIQMTFSLDQDGGPTAREFVEAGLEGLFPDEVHFVTFLEDKAAIGIDDPRYCEAVEYAWVRE